MKTTLNFQEDFLLESLCHELGISRSQVCSPRGQENRMKRRVAVWAFHEFLNSSKERSMRIFKIESLQGLRKIIGKRQLPEDEYNFRISIRKRLRKCYSNAHGKQRLA